MTEGILFDIQRFSLHDGPGIRTTAFLKGCPLACRWCHNPEGRDASLQLRFFREKCLGCGRCTAHTGLAPAALAGAQADEEGRRAAQECPSGALALCGARYTPRQLVELIERDRDFYGEKGGVTFSGGEPSRQPAFLEEALRLCRARGIHTALDSCGYAPSGVYRRLLPLCDMVMFDLKGMDAAAHRHYTGQGNGLILENFQLAAACGRPLWVRIPLIGSLTASEEALAAIADFLTPCQQAVSQVTLMPYHSFGNGKYKTLGLTPEEFPEVPDERVRAFEEFFARRGFTVRR